VKLEKQQEVPSIEEKGGSRKKKRRRRQGVKNKGTENNLNVKKVGKNKYKGAERIESITTGGHINKDYGETLQRGTRKDVRRDIIQR